jgi:hypothetical protein
LYFFFVFLFFRGSRPRRRFEAGEEGGDSDGGEEPVHRRSMLP